MNPTRPSTRSIVAGFVLAVALCAINSYLTLSFGVIEEGPTIAALFFFAFFFLSKTRIATSEMVIVATMGSAGGSLGFISNFYAAKAMTGEPYTLWQMTGFAIVTSLVGIVFTVPLRDLLVLREKLPWPGARATASVIEALVERGDPKQPRYLAATVVLAGLYVLLNDDGGFGLVPSATPIGLFGLAAFGTAVSWSPFALGGSYLMGLRTCVGFLFGAIVLLILAPRLPEPAAPHRFVWIGIGFLVSSGLTLMAVSWRMIAASLASLTRLGSASEDDDPVVSRRTLLVFGAVALVTTLLFSKLVLGLSVVLVAVLIVIGGFLQNVIATRAAAQTAFNPARVMGVLLQGVSALAGGSNAATNLAGAGFVAGSGAQAGALTGDMAYGRWLKVPSRWQFWAQTATVVPCALVSAWVFLQIRKTASVTLEGEGLPAPVAKAWAAAALIFDGSREMPPHAMMALAIAAAVGVVYVLVEQKEALRRWMPCSIGLGLGLVLPIAYDLSFFLGGLLFWVVLQRWLRVRSLTLTTVAVGCIVAEGIAGIAKPILQIAGVLSP